MPYGEVSITTKLTVDEKKYLGRFLNDIIRKLPGKEKTNSTIIIRDDAFFYHMDKESAFFLNLLVVGELPFDEKDAFVKTIAAFVAENYGIYDADCVTVNIVEQFNWGGHGRYIVVDRL